MKFAKCLPIMQTFFQTCDLRMRVCFYSLWLQIHAVYQFTNAVIPLGAKKEWEGETLRTLPC